MNIDNGIDFLKIILPTTYSIKRVDGKDAIRCKSDIGLRVNKDSDDDEHWGHIEEAIKGYFSDNLQEIYFNTHSYYQDFVIYLKP